MKEIEKLSKYSEIIPENQLTEIKGGWWIEAWVCIKMAEWSVKLGEYLDSLTEQK